MARLRPRVRRPDVDEAIDVLRRLQTEMEQRYELLLDQRRRKVEQGDGLKLHLAGCDELASCTSGGERKAREELNTLCADLIRRGRAAGVVWIGAAQKPSADVVPPRCATLWAIGGLCAAPPVERRTRSSAR
ncbi:MAG: hypothetical protein ACRDYX_21235 [Egibacteraceae bacterium]